MRESPTEWYTTSTILRGLGDYGDDRTWRRLTDRFRPPIVRFAREMGLSPSDADDVAQEALIAFASAYREGRYDPEKGRLGRWLFGIAYRTALNRRRAEARRGAVVSVGEATGFLAGLPDEHTAGESWDREWEEALLHQCLEQTKREVEPQTYRAFELVVCDSYAPDKAAELLNVPIKTVYNAKHRVLKRIRELRADLENVE
jgi:RNA polymerase sigma-70 factor (ECF subfamily)